MQIADLSQNNVISALSVSFAMFCLIQFYYQIKQDISEYSPLIKVLSIKLVIFFVFWQTVSSDPYHFSSTTNSGTDNPGISKQ